MASRTSKGRRRSKRRRGDLKWASENGRERGKPDLCKDSLALTFWPKFPFLSSVPFPFRWLSFRKSKMGGKLSSDVPVKGRVSIFNTGGGKGGEREGERKESRKGKGGKEGGEEGRKEEEKQKAT